METLKKGVLKSRRKWLYFFLKLWEMDLYHAFRHICIGYQSKELHVKDKGHSGLRKQRERGVKEDIYVHCEWPSRNSRFGLWIQLLAALKKNNNKKLKDVQLPSFFQTPETTPFNSSLALRVLPATDLIHPITHTLIQCFFSNMHTPLNASGETLVQTTSSWVVDDPLYYLRHSRFIESIEWCSPLR